MKIKINYIFSFALILLFSGCTLSKEKMVSSPDGKIKVIFYLNEAGKPYYDVNYGNEPVISNSSLGLIRDDADFSTGLQIESADDIVFMVNSYSLIQGKKIKVVCQANKLICHLADSSGEKMDIIFQVSNDGVVFRYAFPDYSEESKKISSELTSFNFPDSTTGWLQPRAKSKSGWNQVNPSYEENYIQDFLLSSLSANDSGWVFPVLLHSNKFWISLTESWPNRDYCGSHLNKGKNPFELIIDFPEPTEGFTNGVVYPESKLPWSTPWRIITIGDNLKTLAESTLGTDVAEISEFMNTDYVKPGRAAWSWALMKDASVNFEVQKQFIDYAADMGWEYCLIDVNWDTTIGWKRIKELADIAAQKNVGLILWYNSAGDWNTVPYHPKDRLLTTESRNKEFSRLQEIGIKGIKVDFFGGDGQSMMAYYLDILNDAHKYRLMVNCHGATLPRGLQRTYPNLVSMESIRGFEFATFSQESADKVPTKATLLPFTRNIFDPMDFTPVCFTDYDNNTRITGNAAELAQAIIFLSGVQHYAETPAGIAKVPGYVKEMMKEIPVAWDETCFIDGYPGKFIIIARKKGEIWYVAGINAEKNEKEFKFSLAELNSGNALLITEGDSLRSFQKKEFQFNKEDNVDLKVKANGGFVMKIAND